MGVGEGEGEWAGDARTGDDDSVATAACLRACARAEEGWVTRHGRRRRRRRHRAARRGTRGPLAAPGRHLGGRDGGKGEGGRGTETGGHDFDDVGGTQVVAAHLLLENAQVLQSYYP